MRFAITLPSSWSVSSGSPEPESPEEGTGREYIKMTAFDPSPRPSGAKFSSSLTVLESPTRRKNPHLQDYFPKTSHLEPGEKLTEKAVLKLPQGEAAFYRTERTLTRPDGKQLPAVSTRYVFMHGDNVIELAFTVDQRAASDYNAVIAGIAESFTWQ